MTAKCSRLFYGDSVHFRFSTPLYLENDWSWSKTDQNSGLGCKYYCIQDTFDRYVFKASLGLVGAFPIFDKICLSKIQVVARRSKRT